MRKIFTLFEIFLPYLKYFIQHSGSCSAQPAFLILKNHKSHISRTATKLAKKNGVVLLTLLSIISHKLQPLDKAVFGALKTYFNQAVDTWMRSNPNKTFCIMVLLDA